MFKRIFSFLSAILILLTLCSCGKNKADANYLNAYNLPQKISSIKSGIIAENNRISIAWDMDKSCVIVTDKQTDAKWSTIPYDYYNSGEEGEFYQHDALTSPIRISYVDLENNEGEATVNSDVAYTTAKKLDDGILITYYFDEIGISVPIMIRLEEDGITAELDTKNITEGDKKIVSVDLLPFFASVKNNTDSYILVPSGSGGIMKTDDNIREPRIYKESVYGEDAVHPEVNIKEYTENVRMPIFGVKAEKNGMLAIITDGAETASITANAGDSQYGYSCAYATFNLRGKSVNYIESGITYKVLKKFSDDVVFSSRPKVKYILLSGEENNYSGMAKAYRNYLKTEKNAKTDADLPDVMLTVLGGVTSRKLALGIPYETVVPLTEISAVKDILSDLKSGVDLKSSAVLLKGFGMSGLDYSEIGGGFEISSKLGSKKDLNTLSDWCEKNKTDLGYDFEMIYFKDSANGFKEKESAKTAGGLLAKKYDFNMVTRNREDAKALLAGRYALAISGNLITDNAKKLNLKGVGLSSLVSTAYSDYNSPQYYCKAHMSDDTVRLIETVQKAGLKTFGQTANAYAVTKLDFVLDTPTDSSKYHIIDETLPLYQMVFRGVSAISGGAINLATNPETEFLKTASMGCSPCFTVCDEYKTEIISGTHSAAAVGVYNDISDVMKKYISELKPLLQKTQGAEVESYEVMNNVSTTVFSNGVKVCVNFGLKAENSPLGEVAPRSFIFV